MVPGYTILVCEGTDLLNSFVLERRAAFDVSRIIEVQEVHLPVLTLTCFNNVCSGRINLIASIGEVVRFPPPTYCIAVIAKGMGSDGIACLNCSKR